MFSELVDEIVETSGRGDRRADICAYVRATIRECQSMQYFNRDIVEDEITPTSDPFIWDKPAYFRLMRTVRYPSIGFVHNLPPGRLQEGQEAYYYGGSTYFTFKGMLLTEDIQVAYYSYARRFNYYASTARPAVYNYANEAGEVLLEGKALDTWYYLVNGAYVTTTGDDDVDEAARNLVANWLLIDWNPLIREGTLAKLYQSNDDPRAPKSFSLFNSFKKDLLKGESFDALNF